MAKIELSNVNNIPGPLFVDTTCINCGTCYNLAPHIFLEKNEYSVVQLQPKSLADWSKAREAIVSCPTSSIGARNAGTAFKKAVIELPRIITDGIYYCGYTSKDSFGASSYFIRHPEGNILVDSPRFNLQLANKLRDMGGVDLMFLTHRDDVADHKKYSQYFKCKRVIHRLEVNHSTKDCEIIIDGEKEIDLLPFLKAIPTPGHTRGHMVLLYQEHYLFSGDHLFFDPKNKKIFMSKEFNWYSWPMQIASLKKLSKYYSTWIFPGHSIWGHMDAQDFRSQIAEICKDFYQGELMNKVEDIMHENPEFCTMETRIPDVLYLMKKYDYSEMAVVNGEHVPVGIITVEAISDENLQEYIHPFDVKAQERMKPLEATVKRESSLEECLAIMEKFHTSTLPVVDEFGTYCGFIKKSDIVRH